MGGEAVRRRHVDIGRRQVVPVFLDEGQSAAGEIGPTRLIVKRRQFIKGGADARGDITQLVSGLNIAGQRGVGKAAMFLQDDEELLGRLDVSDPFGLHEAVFRRLVENRNGGCEQEGDRNQRDDTDDREFGDVAESTKKCRRRR